MERKANSVLPVTKALIQGYFRLYPHEAAKQLNNLSTTEILRYLESQTMTTASELFVHLNPDIAVKLIEAMDDDFFRHLFTAIDPARGILSLARLDDASITRRLSLLPESLAAELRELMSFPPDSAGQIMDPRVTVFQADDTVEEALRRIRSLHNRRVMDVCLVDPEGYLTALIPLQRVAVAELDARLGDLARGTLIRVQAVAPRDDVVQLLEENKLSSIPVVDIDDKLLGIIRYDTLVSATKQTVSDDLQTMFGAGRDERALSRVPFAIRKRLPWLEINLVTAFLAAAVVGLFEDTIARITALAVFLPVVAGQSGNTGSQALAVTMRGLALREIRTRHWFQIVRKEASVGFFNGCVIALTTAVVCYIWMGSAGLAAVIGIAMVISMVVAGVSGAVIPIILKTFGQDPAQSSSIVLTTVTDVVGFLSFLGLAKLLASALQIG